MDSLSARNTRMTSSRTIRFFIVASTAAVVLAGCRHSPRAQAWVRTPTGLSYQTLRIGTGDSATNGMRATIHETTTLLNGTVIFDSYAKNTPVTFLLGGNQVIKGVEEGVTGMRVGEKRRLLVPPSLSSRASYPANTPRDSTLRIDVELVSIKRP